ncbi:MAG: histidine kinase [Desulfobulbus propionicus]|nr:MAG: histidine kinase [Desulfobulbus propionicus]
MTFLKNSDSWFEAQRDELLSEGECILVVDASLAYAGLVRDYLIKKNFAAVAACSAEGMQQTLREKSIALVLLDIELPDANGQELLPRLMQDYQDLVVIMVTIIQEVDTVLACMRQGADDYLPKPVQFPDMLASIHKVLEKRRLKINSRHFQKAMEIAQFRLQLAHELSQKMNTAFLGQVELNEVLQAVLVGITAREGLQFNRAFLALFDEKGEVLQGRMAIGPGSREHGGLIWQSIHDLDLDLHDLLTSSNVLINDTEVNRIVRAIKVEASNEGHIFIRAIRSRKSIRVENGKCEYPVSMELIGLLQEETFVVVPLFSSSRSLGVIIADHFITRKPISPGRILALESFASQASLAIEHSRLFMNMEHKIRELEEMAGELEKNKNLLIETERYSAVGHVAAQLAHSIRNPITSIGGMARLLARKTSDPEWLQFLNMMMTESEKIETILEDLLSFVEKVQPRLVQTSLLAVIRKSLLLYASTMKKKRIRQNMRVPDTDVALRLDATLMQKVIVHLLRNSLDAMPDGGELTIAVTPQETEVEVSITDTGTGIHKPVLQQAADPFFTTKTIGTGIGLTFVKRIIDDHQGRMRIEAGSEGGTRVVIWLPRNDGEEGARN